ncbi:hypothetical protein [Micromonospora haikouensis]|uniref:hypothetical protein n=1 Tax=Micromonospora haikouensis TaxID=686309 RepID=UPI003D737FC9
MAVRIDIDALRDAAGPVTCAAADSLRAAGQPERLVPVGGGASGVVSEAGQPPYEVWVGVTTDGFTAECDCLAAEALCAHAMALSLAALEDELPWSSAATPPSVLSIDAKVAELAEIARGIPARRLTMLVAEWAATDRVLESALLARAGRLAPPSTAELDDLRRTIDGLAHEATDDRYWDLHDVEKTGRAIAEEIEVLAQRPPTPEALLVVEEAARAWDRIVPPLLDAREAYEEEVAEIGDALRAAHVRLCEQVQPDPDELAARLTEIIEAAEVDSCLDEPWDYLAVLGRQRVKALRQLH